MNSIDLRPIVQTKKKIINLRGNYIYAIYIIIIIDILCYVQFNVHSIGWVSTCSTDNYDGVSLNGSWKYLKLYNTSSTLRGSNDKVENLNYVKTNVSENIKRCFMFREFRIINLYQNIALKIFSNSLWGCDEIAIFEIQTT